MSNNQFIIDLKVTNNQITNIESIISILNNKILDDNLIEHITSLKNHIENMEITNKEELMKVINSKIIEYNTKNNNQSNNLEALKLLQQTNEEFQKLSIIETSRVNNDSNKYIDYFTYKNKYGEVEVLSFVSSNILSEYIHNNIDEIPNLTAEELFNQLKNLGCEELHFSNKDEADKNNINNKSIVNDPEIEAQEYKEVEEYKQKSGVNDEIRISVSEVGERLYQLGDGLIKFRSVDGKRLMEVLKQPTIKETNTYDEMLAELDQEPTIEHNEIINITTATKTDTYESLDNITFEQFNKNKLVELVSKKDIYGTNLTEEEEHFINVQTKYLLELFDQENCPDEFREILTDLMEKKRGNSASIIERFESYNNKVTHEDELNDLEIEFARIYLNKLDKVKELTKNNIRKLELKQDTKQEANHGIATIIMVLEIIILAMFILMFLHLDI